MRIIKSDKRYTFYYDGYRTIIEFEIYGKDHTIVKMRDILRKWYREGEYDDTETTHHAMTTISSDYDYNYICIIRNTHKRIYLRDKQDLTMLLLAVQS